MTIITDTRQLAAACKRFSRFDFVTVDPHSAVPKD